MFRLILQVLGAVLIAGAAVAADTSLQRLDTRDDSRGWEAVGRLEIAGIGFCTGALIAPDLVLTAAHCLYDKRSGQRISARDVEFRAGWRNGNALAFRGVKRAAVHPKFVFNKATGAERVRHDVALLQLERPIRDTVIIPFETSSALRRNDKVAVVSYAHDRPDAPSLQKVCNVLSRQHGVYVLSCEVDFGSSGAPVFQIIGGRANIVSLVTAKAELDGQPVAIGAGLAGPLKVLQAQLNAPQRRQVNRISAAMERARLGAKFVRANGG